jgi:hypothetical protein
MNVNTNELRDVSKLTAKECLQLETMGFINIPSYLEDEAKKILAGNESVIVPRNNNPLAIWAEKVRQNQLKGKLKNLLK